MVMHIEVDQEDEKHRNLLDEDSYQSGLSATESAQRRLTKME